MKHTYLKVATTVTTCYRKKHISKIKKRFRKTHLKELRMQKASFFQSQKLLTFTGEHIMFSRLDGNIPVASGCSGTMVHGIPVRLESASSPTPASSDS